MTVKQKVQRMITLRIALLALLSLLFALLCYFTYTLDVFPENGQTFYFIMSIALSATILLYIAFKIGFWRLIFSKEIIGTITTIKEEQAEDTFFSPHQNWWTYCNKSVPDKAKSKLHLYIKQDDTGEIIKYRVSSSKTGTKIYAVGDRVYLIKGTRYPINLTREQEQHICPICGHDGFEDECPDCKIRFDIDSI